MSKDFKEVFPLEGFEVGDEKFETEALKEAFKAAKAELSEGAQKAVKSALLILSKWSDDLPDNVKKAIGVLAKSVDYGEAPASQAARTPEAAVKEVNEHLTLLDKRVKELEGKKEDPAAKGKGDDDDDSSFTAEEIVTAAGKALSTVIKEGSKDGSEGA